MAFTVAKKSIVNKKSVKVLKHLRSKLKVKSFSLLKQNANSKKLKRMKLKLAEMIVVKKSFNKWMMNQVKLSKSKTQHRIVLNFREYSIMRKGFN